MVLMCTVSKIMIMLYLLCFVFSKRHDTRPRKMVIDADPGGDDALAVMLAVMHEAKTREIEILAITATYGNTNLTNVEKNLLKILTVANRNIPVYAGPQKPLINKYETDYYFGNDGFGDFNFTQNITAKIDRSKHASVALVDLVRQYPGEITVITLGPLTTVATAIALEPHFLHLVKQHIMMGASVKSKRIEFNFKQDPESNWIVLNNTNKPSIILPIDTVNSHAFSMDEYRRLFNNLDNSIASFLYKAERKVLEKGNIWEPADGIAMAIALQPDMIMQSFETNLTPVLVGDARGSALINSDSRIRNAKVIKYFDKAAFKRLLLKTLSK
ncbi:PREDICTED: inosine-uridine preferring nucleoside hydrolase-like [Vollenhovia emeryi]|uniref:inosine-uridine preferring nucleoside hydrolase-like n=1 Tax=Vollenhovia emeryi TaxID=411798 RepID=UPI0005F50187|nr:PREDICTED: inosine-uridine preferring nucleoside hydrolase-like [Vollenhovia emeryi]XP_011881376.1 PREDICTED: inosine-uridine preferring nucleoside hydrolase-like [Vollenhovia emeryi]